MAKQWILALAISSAAVACGGAQTDGDTTNNNGQNLGTPGGGTNSANNKTPDAKPDYVATGTPSKDLIPRTVFFGDPDRAGVQISPDGKHLSWRADSGGEMNVWVAPRSDLSKAKAITNDTKRPVSQYFWAPTSKHILYMQDAGGDENYHIFSVDIASGKKLDLTPMKKIRAQVVKVSHKRPTEIVVGINDRNPQLHDLYKVNVATGEKSLVLENPGFIGFDVDDNFNVVLGARMMPTGGTRIMKRGKVAKAKKARKVKAPAKGGKALPIKPKPVDPFAGWTTFTDIEQADSLTTNTAGFDRSGRNVYMWDSRGRNTNALKLVSLKTGKGKIIASHPKADGSGMFVHPTKKTVMAVSFTHARREWKILDKSLKRDIAKLAKLSDGEPMITDGTLDNKTWIVAFEESDGPVRYYLWDRKKQKEQFLFTNNKRLEGLKLSKMHSRVVKSRDDKELVNYLSLPPASDPDADGVPSAAQPMVLLVHGGPWGRDNWGYNPLHQLLANRGYAVMSVNFRGSTGLGKDFTNAGDGEWSGKMHDDLIDSVNWAVKNKIAAKDKVCIAGGSYGGYATLVGLTFTPDVFACGVDIVGPSNIVTLLEAIPPYWKPMQDLFKTRVGDWTTAEGKAKLLAQSPLTHVDKIVKPLLIGQGANDPRVKKAESDQIVAAMKARKIPVSYVLFPDEGHGFRREPNRLAFFAAMEAFLSAHLGGVYQPVSAEEIKGSSVKVPSGVHGIPGFPAVVK